MTRTSERMKQAQKRHYGFKPPRSESAGDLNMTDFEIVKNYMATKYPEQRYSMRYGNGNVWVTIGYSDVYFYIHKGVIIDIQFD